MTLCLLCKELKRNHTEVAPYYQENYFCITHNINIQKFFIVKHFLFKLGYE